MADLGLEVEIGLENLMVVVLIAPCYSTLISRLRRVKMNIWFRSSRQQQKIPMGAAKVDDFWDFEPQR